MQIVQKKRKNNQSKQVSKTKCKEKEDGCAMKRAERKERGGEQERRPRVAAVLGSDRFRFLLCCFV